MHGNIPFLLFYWSKPVVHLSLLKKSMAGRLVGMTHKTDKFILYINLSLCSSSFICRKLYISLSLSGWLSLISMRQADEHQPKKSEKPFLRSLLQVQFGFLLRDMQKIPKSKPSQRIKSRSSWLVSGRSITS